MGDVFTGQKSGTYTYRSKASPRLYDGRVQTAFRAAGAMLIGAVFAGAQSFSAPAGIRPAVRHTGASILPGGRIVSPIGKEYPTGPGAFGLAVSASGRMVATSNTGPGRNSLTLLERQKTGEWDVRQIVPPVKEAQEKG